MYILWYNIMLKFLLNHMKKLKNHFLIFLKIILLNCINTIKDYMNPLLDRKNKVIYKDNNKKSGIYMFTNKLNNKRYVGSAIDLHKRISRYFQKGYLNNSKHENRLIIRAIKKYGIENFYISIIEYVNINKKDLIRREQYWLDTIKPEYNILKQAGNSLGYKHRSDVKLKLSLMKIGKKLSLEIKNRMSATKKISKLIGHKHTLETKLKLSEIARKRTKLPKPGISLLIKDIISGDTKKYRSIREAARDLKCSTETLRVRTLTENIIDLRLRRKNIDLLRGKLFRNRYIITLINASTFHSEDSLNK